MTNEERRLRFGRWLRKKRNFALFGTLSVGVGGYILTIALVAPTLEPAPGFWLLMFPVCLLGGYVWAIAMWHLWWLPLRHRIHNQSSEWEE